MRNTQATIEGKEYPISSLTYDQVEEFFPGGAAKVQGNTVRIHTSPVVAAALNNRAWGTGYWFPDWDNPAEAIKRNSAAAGCPIESPICKGRSWTPKLLTSELDLAEILGLYRAITKFSGMTTRAEDGKVETDAIPEEKKMGEVTAVA